MTRRRSPAFTPDHRQQGALRDELHEQIDYVMDRFDLVHRMSRDMGAGYGSAAGDRSGNGETTVERLAFSASPDPAAWANDALAEWDEAVAHVRNAANRIRRLMPLTEEEAREVHEQKREADTPQCADCKSPIFDKVKRIDGQPYHATSCYFRVWRSRGKPA